MAKKLLLCDDEIFILKAAEFKLKKAGYEVHLAYDGEEGFRKFQTLQPDMIITDYQMPRLNGLELIARIREKTTATSLPIILLTAKGLEFNRSELILKHDLAAVMSKPFSPRELVQYVERTIGPAVARPAIENAAQHLPIERSECSSQSCK